MSLLTETDKIKLSRIGWWVAMRVLVLTGAGLAFKGVLFVLTRVA